VAQTFFVDEYISEAYYLDAILTVVDAAHVTQHLDDVKSEGVENEARRGARTYAVFKNPWVLASQQCCLPSCTPVRLPHRRRHTAAPAPPPDPSKQAVEQIAFADRILLNKVDLVAPKDLAAVRSRITAINAQAEVIETTRARVPIDKLLGIGGFSLERVLEHEPGFLKARRSFQKGFTAARAACAARTAAIFLPILIEIQN
jgi:G3E family GTPase